MRSVSCSPTESTSSGLATRAREMSLNVQQAVEARLDFDERAVGHEVRTVPVTVSPSLSAARRPASSPRACSSRTTRRSTTTSSSATSSLVMRQVICCADEGFELGCIARAAAAGGHEGADADVDAEAALDDGGDGSGDGDLFGEGALEGRPVAGLRDADSAKARSSPLRCGR